MRDILAWYVLITIVILSVIAFGILIIETKKEIHKNGLKGILKTITWGLCEMILIIPVVIFFPIILIGSVVLDYLEYKKQTGDK